LVGIVTGVLTGGITGYFTALYAMRQFKAQRAFDRQLEWYERTARALATLRLLQIDAYDAKDSERDVQEKASDELKKGFFDLQQCTNEAVLYAEQSSYEQLHGMGNKALSMTTEVLRDTLIELSKPVRKMLGLKKIVLKAGEK